MLKNVIYFFFLLLLIFGIMTVTGVNASEAENEEQKIVKMVQESYVSTRAQPAQSVSI